MKKQFDISKYTSEISPPKRGEFPFDIKMCCLSYDEIVEVWERVRQGVPQEIAWRAIGKFHLYEAALTLVRMDLDLKYEDTKLYHYLDKFYYQCLAQVSMALYQKAASSEMHATNAAKLLLEYNELLLARNKNRMVL